MKKRLIAAIVSAALVVTAAPAAMAFGVISDVPGGSYYFPRDISLQVYNNSLGINADNVPLYVRTSEYLVSHDAINIQLTNGRLNEGAWQPLIEARGGDILLNGGACSNALDPYTFYVVGEGAPQGVVNPVTHQIYDTAAFCLRNADLGPMITPGTGSLTIPPAATISTGLGVIDQATGAAIVLLNQGLNIYVEAGLNPTCTTAPAVSLTYVTAREFIGPTKVLQIVPPDNHAPTISGTPATTASVGAYYIFTPTGGDEDQDRLSYSITNKPAWANFNTLTGALSGTPPAAGTYDNIEIFVFDNSICAPRSASLPPFSITVVDPNPEPVTSFAPAASFCSKGGHASVMVGAGTPFPSTSDSWIHLGSVTSDGAVSFDVGPNGTGSHRNGLVAAGSKGIPVYQARTEFLDSSDTIDNWAYNYICGIYAKGITQGCDPTAPLYCPDESVTRQQMAAFVVRAMFTNNFSLNSTIPYYNDVDSDNLYFKYVQKMREAGLAAPNPSYDPMGLVTREQMAAFIIRALYGENFSYTPAAYFADVAPESKFFKYVQKMKDEGLTANNGVYNATSYVTRKEMAVFLGRAFLGMK